MFSDAERAKLLDDFLKAIYRKVKQKEDNNETAGTNTPS